MMTQWDAVLTPGLSYTTFKLTNIDVSAHTDPLARDAPANSKNLYDTLAWVSVDVCNTGDKYGTEVPQVYIGSPAEGAPAKVLRGFEATPLNPGETKRVTFELTRRDLRYVHGTDEG
jgi:beta-glucosidase